MDNKRAAIVATAGVGLLVSALVLRKLTQKRHREQPLEIKAVVLAEDRHDLRHNNVADAV